MHANIAAMPVGLLLLVLLSCGSAEEVRQEKVYKLSADAPPVTHDEQDAMKQAATSEQMKGMKLGRREVAADGMSGRMFLQPEDGARFQWAPKFATSLRNLRKKVESEDLVLAYFFSSEEEELSASHEKGQRFETAAKELLEGEHELSLLMIDLKHEAALDRDILREYGVFKPHTYKLFINGRPSTYHGRIDAEGLVAYMNERAGPPSTKIESAAALDELLAHANGTTIVGIFGAGYEGASAKDKFITAASDMRDMSFRFVDMSSRVANGVELFGGGLDTSKPIFAVVPSSAWLAPGEETYRTSTDFRRIANFVGEHGWTKLSPFSDALVSRVAVMHPGRRGPGTRPVQLASILIDTSKHASHMRRVIEQCHQLIGALPAEVAAHFMFAIADRSGGRLDSWFDNRFERTTIFINGRPQFFTAAKFASEYADDFTLIISDTRTSKNWISNELAGVLPEVVQLDGLATFLSRVARGEERHLPQGDSAAAAAGLRQMKMDFGMDGGGFSAPEPTAARRPKGKKGKAKGVPTSDKAEL